MVFAINDTYHLKAILMAKTLPSTLNISSNGYSVLHFGMIDFATPRCS